MTTFTTSLSVRSLRRQEDAAGVGAPARGFVVDSRSRVAILVSMGAVLLASCLLLGSVPAVAEVEKTPAAERAQRRAYDGAPPVIGHEDFGMACTECHNARGVEIEGIGFAPPSPHEETLGLSAMSRCRQCHVFKESDELLVANGFRGLQQDLRPGGRLNPLSPPTIPHKTFMRENCAACHTGEAAREEIRTSHPERTRCRQCHVPVMTRSRFSTGAKP